MDPYPSPRKRKKLKDGKEYFIDSQELQGRQAYKSGLSHFYKKSLFSNYIILWMAICWKKAN